MSAEFSLRAIAISVLLEMDTEDRESVLKEIERRIPAEMLGEALHQAIPAFAHSVMPRWPSPVPDLADSGKARATGRSSKVAAIRDAWKRHLEGRYTVEDGSLRRLGDFRQEDLIFMAGQLEDKARRNRTRAKAMKDLAAALGEHKVTVVRDLPPDFLAGFFGTGKAAA